MRIFAKKLILWHFMSYDVFISYRRKGSGAGVAGELQSKLQSRGYKVFLDVDNIGSGAFPDQIDRAIQQCNDFLLILSPGMLDRCADEEDWVRFASGDRLLQYENDKIIDVTQLMASVYYPESEKDKTVQVLSNNGNHKLTYRRGVPSVEIDGVKVADSEPCYAIYDERNNMFVWNAVEPRDMKTELVIYRFSVGNKIFKK